MKIIQNQNILVILMVASTAMNGREERLVFYKKKMP